MAQTHRKICFKKKPKRCSVCSSTESLHVHHADGDKTNNELDNLIPLCHSCHRLVHSSNSTDRGEIVALRNRLIKSDYRLPSFNPSEYDGVPTRAGVTIKETYPGCHYYYFQWRVGEKVKCEYIGPVKGKTPEKDNSQKTMDDFTSA